MENINEDIKINDDSVDPNKYFEIVKNNKKQINYEKLESQLKTLAENIIAAKEAGQENYLNSLVFSYNTIFKEQIVLAEGYGTYVYSDDVKNYLDCVKDKTVKIIELENYPRSIPLDVLNKIRDCKKKQLFDEYIIVFTDFTKQTYHSEEQKQYINKNRDPIVFGVFYEKNVNIKHDRMYYIADWEDDYCDLTFGKMIDEMTKHGIDDAERKIEYNKEYLNEIVMTQNEKFRRQPKNHFIPQAKKENDNFWQRLKKKFSS